MKYIEDDILEPEQVDGKKKLLVCTHIANCRKIGKIYFTKHLLSNEFFVLYRYYYTSFGALLPWTFPGFIDIRSHRLKALTDHLGGGSRVGSFDPY